jgi:desumoylating isopeptidase 1
VSSVVTFFFPTQRCPTSQIDAIWHTSVVVHGREYYFGQGVFSATPGGTHHGAPLRTVDLGHTTIDADSVAAWVAAANAHEFCAAKYHLLNHNCNHFSAAFCEFLTGANRVPSEYTDQGHALLQSPLGAALTPFLGGLEAALRVHDPDDAPATAAVDRTAAAIAVAAGSAAIADADADAAAGHAPATASITPLAAQEAAVAADVSAADAGDARAKAELEALIRAEYDAVRASSPALTPNEAVIVALERARVAMKAQKAN